MTNSDGATWDPALYDAEEITPEPRQSPTFRSVEPYPNELLTGRVRKVRRSLPAVSPDVASGRTSPWWPWWIWSVLALIVIGVGVLTGRWLLEQRSPQHSPDNPSIIIICPDKELARSGECETIEPYLLRP